MIDDDRHDLAHIHECAKWFNRRNTQILSLRCDPNSYFIFSQFSTFCFCVFWYFPRHWHDKLHQKKFLLHLKWFIFLYSIFYSWWIILNSEIPEPKLGFWKKLGNSIWSSKNHFVLWSRSTRINKLHRCTSIELNSYHQYVSNGKSNENSMLLIESEIQFKNLCCYSTFKPLWNL